MLVREVGGGFALGIVSREIVQSIGVFLDAATRKPLVAVTQTKVSPYSRHDPSRRNPVPDTEVDETMLKLLEQFSESLIRDDPELVKKKLLAEKESWRRPYCANRTSLSVVTEVGMTVTPKTKKAGVIGTKGSNDSKPKVRSQCAHAFPERPELWYADDTDHTRQMQKTDV